MELARRLEVETRALELFIDVRGALHRRLLGLPHLLEVGMLALELLQLYIERLQPRISASLDLIDEAGGVTQVVRKSRFVFSF